MMNKPDKGFIPVMLTPFMENGAIDFYGLSKLTEFYIKAGAAGLFANCLSSEMFELTETERIQIIEKVVEVTGGQVPVVATGTFGGDLQQQAGFIKRVYATGAEAVICISGLLAGEAEEDEVFEANMDKLLELTDNIPLGFYECPVPYKRLVSPGHLGRLVATGRVTYHKDTSLDIDQIKAKIAATKGHKFGLYDAYMGHAVASLKAGAAGLSCIQGNFFPELITWLCKNYDDPLATEQVNLVQQFLIDHMDVMHHVYPTVSKYYLQKRGFAISTFTRRNDIGVFNLNIEKDIDALYHNYQLLSIQLELKQVMV